ncbi:hypothetical protein BH10BAC5_BH10BAC5_12280 [soil metagenome]
MENKSLMTELQKKAPLSNLNPLVFVILSLGVVFFLYQIIGGMIAYGVLGADMTAGGNLVFARIIISFSQFMFILAPAVFLVYLKGDNLKTAFRLKMPKLNILLLSIAGTFVIQPFLQFYLYFQNKFIFSIPFLKDYIGPLKELFDKLEATTLSLVSSGNILELIGVVVVIAVTPAICEEFLFRGLVLFNLEKIKTPAISIFITGFLFAAFHFHPFNLIPLIILGVFLSFIVYHSGSIITSVICHFINNFIAAFAVYYYGKDITSESNVSPSDVNSLIITGVVSLLIFASIVYFIKRSSVEND